MRTKPRRTLARPQLTMLLPDTVNQRWSIDLLSEQLANGRRTRVLNVVDDFSRECVEQVVDFSMSSQRLAGELNRLGESPYLPETIVCDHGPELTCKAMLFWSKRTGMKLDFVQAGPPARNAFVESFTDKFRDYCLDLKWFASLEDAWATIEAWRHHDSYVRPHRSPGKKPPAVFAREIVLHLLHLILVAVYVRK